MRRILGTMGMLALAATVFAGSPGSDKKENAAFERMKALSGLWKGKTPDGKPVQVSYRVVSSGSAVMETLDMAGTKDNMITMYVPEGDGLLMTHYCSMGNQPRMRADAAAAQGDKLSFSFVDGTNMSSAEDTHMHALVITFKDKNHITQEWTMRAKGQDADHVVFELTRSR